MSHATLDRSTLATRPHLRVDLPAASFQSRALFLFFAAAGLGAGFLITGQAVAVNAAALAGEDLTRLLRGMATIKAAIILPAVAAIFWRLGASITLAGFTAYTAAAVAMTLSIGLIWHMAHVGPGALLMHAGLLGALVLLLRDRAISQHLAETVRRRRAGQADA